MSRRRRSKGSGACGVLVVDKPAGPTSHDVVGWVRWVLAEPRVGHCGTLDPAATGLLVVGVGPATKLAPYFTGQDKGYWARFVLGASTTTADAEGEVCEEVPCSPEVQAGVGDALRALVGTHALPPPAFSAVHVDGRRAHALARAGEAPVLPPRPMTVHAMEPGPVRAVGSRLEVEATLLVSKGTYIRSLAEALGAALGVPAHLGALHRLRSGALHLPHDRAVTGLRACRHQPTPSGPERWRIELGDPGMPREAAAEHLRARLLPPAEAVPLPLLRVRDDTSGQRALARLASGMPVAVDDPGLPVVPPEASPLAVVPARPEAPGLVIVRQEAPGQLQPERVVVEPARSP
ncbi:MAG: tRNA pseudouridine(55) synthase TruB [Myxococcales bacterium]|nr:tRNA pseudouridine(55) synthase TruB [Myxococcales bacterium]